MVNIPEKKRDRNELQKLRMQNAMATRPPVQYLESLALNRFLLGFLYVVALVGAGFLLAAVQFSAGLDLVKIYIALGCGAFSLLCAILIYLKKVRSRHHAAFLGMISLLVLAFGTVYYFEKVEEKADDYTQGLTRHRISQPGRNRAFARSGKPV